MRSARFFLAALLVGSLSGGWAFGQLSPPGGSGADADRLAPLIQMIRQADNPSAAIEAYAKGQAIDRDSVALKSAYLEKMVEFGLPEMADAQAQDLIQRDPSNGLAWGVAAYISAKRDETATALADITIAARQLPDDLFVLRTAGQLLAWYDTKADKSKIPEDVKAAAEAMRKQIAARPAFADAYSKATEVYKQQPQQYDQERDNSAPRPSTRPSAAAEPQGIPNQPAPSGIYQPEPPVTYDDGAGAAYGGGGYAYAPYPQYVQPYTDPYVYVPYGAYSPWWPNTYCGFNWWWPTFTSVVFVNNDCFVHNRKFCVDKDVAVRHHGRFDHHDRWAGDKWHGGDKRHGGGRDGHWRDGHWRGDQFVADRRGRNDVLVRPARDRSDRLEMDRDRGVIRPARDRDGTAAVQRDRASGNRPDAAAVARPNRDRADAAGRGGANNAAVRPQAGNRAEDAVANQARDRGGRPQAGAGGRGDVDRATPPVARREATPRSNTGARDVSPRAANPPRQAAPAPQRVDPAPKAGSSPRLSNPSRGNSGSQLRGSSPRATAPPARSFSSPSRSAAPGRSGMSSSSRMGSSGGAAVRGGGGSAARGGGGGGGGRGGGGGGGRGR